MVRQALFSAVVAGIVTSFAVAPSAAAPKHYDFNFTLTSGSLLPAGGFDYDSATSTFTNFIVNWNGLTFDLTSSANAPIVLGTIYQTQCGVTGGALSFAFLSHAACVDDFVSVDSDVWFAIIPFDFSQPQIFAFDAISFLPSNEIAINATAPYDPNTPPTPAFSRGKWTLTADGTATSIPAPASLGLMALGLTTLPVMLLRRRRGAR